MRGVGVVAPRPYRPGGRDKRRAGRKRSSLVPGSAQWWEVVWGNATSQYVLGLSHEEFLRLTWHEYKLLMDRFEAHQRFLRVELAGTISAAVANFSMSRPEGGVEPSQFFEAAKPEKRQTKRKQHQIAVEAMGRNLDKIGQRSGMVVRNQDGDILAVVGPVTHEHLEAAKREGEEIKRARSNDNPTQV
jgi:hypothetical protein